MKILITVFLVVLFSCGQKKENMIEVFHYNMPTGMTNLDPAFAKSMNNIWACDHIFDRLVKFDSSGRILPALADRWEVRNGGLVYRFFLRKDVRFHTSRQFPEGRKMRASDVVYSFHRILDEKINSPGSWIFQGKVRSENPFIAVSDSVFELHLKEPFSPTLSILSMAYASVVLPEAVEKWGRDFGRHPVGTGPFKFYLWEQNYGLFLHKNEDYFIEKWPKSDGLRVSFIQDRNIAYFEILKNNIDFFSGVDPGFISQLMDDKGQINQEIKGRISIKRCPFLNTEYLGINQEALPEKHILRNVFFRRALNYAINRKTMLQLLRRGLGRPAHKGFVPYGLDGFNDMPKGYHFNRDSVEKMLELSDYAQIPDEQKEIRLYTNKDYVDICTYLIGQWENYGIKVDLEVLETSALREKVRLGTIAFFRASWIADYPDAENFLSVFWSENPAPPNYTRFRNSQFDSLYRKVLITTNSESRRQIISQMDKIIIDEAPVVFLFYDESLWVHRSPIKGLIPNGLNLLDVRTIYEE